jgi:hypothetical protein
MQVPLGRSVFASTRRLKKLLSGTAASFHIFCALALGLSSSAIKTTPNEPAARQRSRPKLCKNRNIVVIQASKQRFFMPLIRKAKPFVR